jgi:hypothetical protein
MRGELTRPGTSRIGIALSTLGVLTRAVLEGKGGLKREPQIKTAARSVKYAGNACESGRFGFDGSASREYVKRS